MIKLKRIIREDITFGVLIKDDRIPICLTLELPWKENKENISCIPEGKYQCKLISSEKFKEAYHVLNVKDRSGILIHSGNTISDSQGCIILGKEFGILNGKLAVLKSISAFYLLKDFVGTEFELEIC